MTLIVSWLSKEEDGHPYIWTAGDTKISNGDSTLSLYGAKILELPLRCKDITTVQLDIYFNSKLTFAYAGSSLTGLNIYCALYAIFTNLGGRKSQNHLPDYNSILLKCKEIFDLYFNTIQSPTEILITGFCPKTNKPFKGKIKPEMNKEGVFISRIHSSEFLEDYLEFELLGDHTEEIKRLILEKLKSSSKIPMLYWRTPQKVLQEIIENQTYQSIGGNMQLAINTPYRFDLYALANPIKGEEPAATLKFRNLDLFDDIGTSVGECRVSINGII